MKKKKKYILANLTKAEKKIYDAIISHFPATNPLAAYDAAIQGGPRFQFIHK